MLKKILFIVLGLTLQTALPFNASASNNCQRININTESCVYLGDSGLVNKEVNSYFVDRKPIRVELFRSYQDSSNFKCDYSQKATVIGNTMFIFGTFFCVSKPRYSFY